MVNPQTNLIKNIKIGRTTEICRSMWEWKREERTWKRTREGRESKGLSRKRERDQRMVRQFNYKGCHQTGFPLESQEEFTEEQVEVE